MIKYILVFCKLRKLLTIIVGFLRLHAMTFIKLGGIILSIIDLVRRMHIIFGNYGKPTIAVIQWAFEAKLHDVTVVSVDTGWQAEGWLDQVKLAESYVKQCDFSAIRLISKPSFQNLMEDRGNFPSTKFQWCAGFLKGLPLLDWLDTHDTSGEATIILGKRRLDSRLNFNLPEFINESEHYGDRRVWYPLFQHSDEQYHALLKNSGLPLLTTRSLECDPCVNSFGNDLARLADNDIIKTQVLEKKLSQQLFTSPIAEMVKQARTSKQKSDVMFDMGCGSPFGCGE